MNTSVRARHAARGFSMVELLVTVVLAGIIFAAMVPVFASALKKTSRDNFRVTATNIAQDRIEKVRQLASGSPTSTHPTSSPELDNPSFAGGQFVTIFTRSAAARRTPSPTPSTRIRATRRSS